MFCENKRIPSSSSTSSTGYEHSRSYRSLFFHFHFIPCNASSHESNLMASKQFMTLQVSSLSL